MPPRTEAVSARTGILRQLCPRCREGRIFRGPLFRQPLAMRTHCDVCGIKFEREQGYFLGAMYVSYVLSLPVVLLLVWAIWHFTGWPFDWSVAAAFVVYLPCVPLVTRYARVIWMYIDQGFDPR